ncbi:hypothetical protein NC653_032052 [Populus alba x Populus x berolinensis]|uniref:Uncharacterized protein n=1 Tax=Populus alba x Populus x berolinensis TaxID=444605 RepID=A0AAD6LQZ0_9ROSI|nr:hypothetical protein NC653_032052 [Populus alba x Populus x berolinensis]
MGLLLPLLHRLFVRKMAVVLLNGPQVVEKPAEAKKEQEDNNLDITESEEREEIGEGQGSKCQSFLDWCTTAL